MATRGRALRRAPSLVSPAGGGHPERHPDPAPHAARTRQHAGLVAAFSGILEQTKPRLVVLTAPFVDSFLEIARAHGASVVVDADQWWGRLNRQIVRTPGPLMPRIRALIETYTLEPMEQTIVSEG